MEFGKRHNRHNGLLPGPTCYVRVAYVADLLQGNWCNGFWPLNNSFYIIYLQRL